MSEISIGKLERKGLTFTRLLCRGNERSCPYYFRGELLIIEYPPHIVNSWRSDDDIEDAVPWGLRVAQHRVASFFNTRFEEVEAHRRRMEALGHVLPGARFASYGEAGECSAFKSQPLTAPNSTQPGAGIPERACRTTRSWLTAYMPLPQIAPFRIVYLGRGTCPCHPKRTRCVRNAADVVETLNYVGLLLSHFYYPAEEGEGMCAEDSLDVTRGCVTINLETNTHTFLEMVDIIRHAKLVVSVQGSQNFNAVFAQRGTAWIEMVPSHKTVRAESNRIYLGSMGMQTAILPIHGIHMHDTTPFTVPFQTPTQTKGLGTLDL